MQFTSLAAFLSNGASQLPAGAVAVLLMEDHAETNSTIRHYLNLGFRNVLVLGDAGLHISPELVERIVRIPHDLAQDNALTDTMNPIIAALTGRWIYYGYNAEYLFYPFCETRSIGEVTAFVAEERRDSVLTYVIDLYAGDLAAHPNGVSLDDDIWIIRAISPNRGRAIICHWTASWICSVACAGGSRNLYLMTGARSTGSVCSDRSRAWS